MYVRLTRDHLPMLTSLRFFAALIVVFHHYAALLGLPEWLNVLMAQGNVAVCFFFLLSGFILVYTYIGKLDATLSSIRGFLWARFARIYPLHGFLLLCITPLTLWYLWYMPEVIQANVRESLTASGVIGSWISNLLLIQVYPFKSIYRQLWNLPAWSISSEVFFYAFFPLILPLLLRIKRSTQVMVALVLVCVLQLGVVIGWFYGCQRWMFGGSATVCVSWGLYGNPLLRFGEFVIGCLLGLLFSQFPQVQAWSTRRRGLMLGVGLLGSMLTLVVPTTVFADPTLLVVLRWHVVYLPWFCLIVLASAWHNWPAMSRVFAHPLLLRLGQASYALYLVHWLPLRVLHYQQAQNYVIPVWLAWLVIASCVGASVLLHRYIEEPARKRLKMRTYVQ